MKIFKSSSLILPLFITCNLLFLSCLDRENLGTKDNPVKIYFTPSIGGNLLSEGSKKFIQYLEEETGLFFSPGLPTNYISVIEAFGTKRADIGFINSFGYLLAHQKYGADAKLKIIRKGLDYYRGQIVVHKDSGIKELSDLQGKKFAFTDPSSSSGYMFPLKLLKENNINPSATIFAQKHDKVITMVYQKQVDAGASFYSAPSKKGEIRDARILVKAEYPDVEEKVIIISVTEKIPNDPVVFRKGVPEKISENFIRALKKFLQTEDGKKTFKEIYNIDDLTEANDSDYDGLRSMIRSINLDLGKLLR